jgi:hypothetical protein
VKVNFAFVEDSDPTAGKRIGVECDVCRRRFFDLFSGGIRPRLLESGISAAIRHAEAEHQSTGGMVGLRKADRPNFTSV